MKKPLASSKPGSQWRRSNGLRGNSSRSRIGSRVGSEGFGVPPKRCRSANQRSKIRALEVNNFGDSPVV